MKIWLDLRFIDDDIYSNFTLELVKWLIEKKSENEFIIYTNKFINWLEYQNAFQKNVWIKINSFTEQTKYLKILNNDKNNIMIFFNHFKPVLYSKEYFILIHSLKDIYYSNFNNDYNKYKYLYLLEKNLKKSKKILCFDNNTVDELIEKFNINEDKINILKWFFPDNYWINDNDSISLDIKTKYWIKNDFLIYSWWEWVEKNYEKLINVFHKMKKNWYEIDLIFLWDEIWKNLSLRNLIINLEMQEQIHFLWYIKPAEKILFYKESLWVLFPSLYETFPFSLSDPLYYNVPIISTDIKNIKIIFWDSIKYFSAMSTNNIYENLIKYIDNKEYDKNLKNDFLNIKKLYSKENSINNLLDIIK